MSPIDFGADLERILAGDVAQIPTELAVAIATLQAKIHTHRLLGGPPLPEISATLDADQEEVVTTAAKTIRLLAPAGSGKTHCIVNKILAHLRADVSPQRLAVVTFDNNSANELRGRCRDLFGSGAPEVSTLNAFGRRVLVKYQWETPAPALINEARGFADQIVKAAIKDAREGRPDIRAVLPPNLKRHYYLDLFSYLKNQLYSPKIPRGPEAIRVLGLKLTPIINTSAHSLFAPTAGDTRGFVTLLSTIDWLFRRYEDEKLAAGYVDFDDQKLLAFELLRDNESVRNLVQGSYDHVIVDEFQDLNELDFRLIQLVSQRTSLLVVGDDDQSIYGFRGTSPSYIIDLERLSGRPVSTIELHTNYRSPKNIVDHATRLIRNNTYRVDKSPRADRSELCDVKVYAALAPGAEAAMVGDFVERVVGIEERTYRDVAILYRMNSQSLPLQLEFVKRGIPYYCRKEDNILGQEYLPRLLAVVKYVADVQARRTPSINGFVQVLRAYFRYLPEELHDGILRAARRAGPPYLAALDDPVLEGSKIHQSNVADAIRQLVNASTPAEVLYLIGSKFKGVRGMVGSLEEAATDGLPLGELSDVAMQFRTLDEFVEFMEECIRRSRQGHTEDYETDTVRLLTYFRSKGAQFDTVILPSLNEGIIPHSRAPIEDERRLFYVAFTRTRRNLWMSYVKKVCNNAVEVSRFLKELDLPRTSWV